MALTSVLLFTAPLKSAAPWLVESAAVAAALQVCRRNMCTGACKALTNSFPLLQEQHLQERVELERDIESKPVSDRLAWLKNRTSRRVSLAQLEPQLSPQLQNMMAQEEEAGRSGKTYASLRGQLTNRVDTQVRLTGSVYQAIRTLQALSHRLTMSARLQWSTFLMYTCNNVGLCTRARARNAWPWPRRCRVQ